MFSIVKIYMKNYFFRKNKGRRAPLRKKPASGMRKRRTTASKVRALSHTVRVMKRQEEVKSLQYPIVDTGLTTYYNGNMGSASTMRLIQLSANSSTLPIPQNSTSSGRVGNKLALVS